MLHDIYDDSRHDQQMAELKYDNPDEEDFIPNCKLRYLNSWWKRRDETERFNIGKSLQLSTFGSLQVCLRVHQTEQPVLSIKGGQKVPKICSNSLLCSFDHLWWFYDVNEGASRDYFTSGGPVSHI